MIWLSVILAGISFAIAFWIGQQLVVDAMQRYRNVLVNDAQANLREMFVFIDLTHLWPAVVCLATSLALLSWLIFDLIFLSLLIAIVALFLPRYALNKAIRARTETFEQQLPDALLAMSSALRAGVSLGVALKQVVQNAEAPFSQELGLVLREQRVGISLPDALANLYTRMPSENIQMMTTLMRVASVSGGSLADLLERLSTTVRARLHLSMKLRVLTSQGTMQAWIVGSLPVVLLIVLNFIDPYSTHLMFYTTAGQIVLFTVIVLETAGALMLKRILQIQP
jgi:tight adherence protein B